MIIRRYYIPFRDLITSEDKGGDLFIKLCKKAYPAHMWERAFLSLSNFALYEREQGWAFHGIEKLIEGFRKLDKEDPYDTVFTLEDARSADILTKDGNTLTLLLRTGEFHNNDIVGLVKVDISNQGWCKP